MTLLAQEHAGIDLPKSISILSGRWRNIRAVYRILLVYAVSTLIYIISSLLHEFLITSVLRALSGILSLIIVPGMLLSNLLIPYEKGRLWSTIIAGLFINCVLIQALFLARLYGTIVVSLNTWIVCFHVVFVLLTVVVEHSGRIEIHDKPYLLQANTRLLSILIIGVVLRLILAAFSTGSIAPDASLYSDYARFILDGQFNTNVLIDSRIYDLGNGVRYCFHQGFIYLSSLSFLLLEPYRAGPTVMLLILGICLILLCYDIGNHFFGKNAAIGIAGIVAIHPVLVFHSVVAYGPEISSLVFILGGLMILVRERRNNRSFLFAGLLIAFSDVIWYSNFFLFLLALPFFLLIVRPFGRRLNLLLSFGMILTMMARVFFLRLQIFSLAVASIAIILVIVGISRHRKTAKSALLFIAGMITVIVFWRFPLQVMEASKGIASLVVGVGRNLSILQAPNPAWQIFFRELSVSVIVSSFSFFVLQLTPPLFVLSMISLVWGKRRVNVAGFLIICLIGFGGTIFVLNTLAGFKEILSATYFYSDSRFFISMVTVVIVSAGGAIQRISDFNSTRLIEEKNRRSPLQGKQLVSLGVLFVVVASFLPNYALIPAGLELTSYEARYGWVNLGEEVKQTGYEEAVFIVDRTTEFSWLTNMPSVKLRLTGRGVSLSRALSNIRSQSNRYNASYIILDEYTVAYWKTFEQILHNPLLLGNGIPLNIQEFDYRANTSETDSLILEYQTPPNQDGDYSRLYRFGTLEFLHESDVNLFSNGWVAGNNGNLINISGSPAIEIGENQNYTFIENAGNFDLNLKASSGFMFLEFQEFSAQVARVEFYSTGGEFLGFSSGLDDSRHFFFVGDSVIGDIRIVVEGEPGGYVVVEVMSLWRKYGS